MSDGSFVLVGDIDDRPILEKFKRIQQQADVAGQGVGTGLQKGFTSSAGSLQAALNTALNKGVAGASAIGSKAGSELSSGFNTSLSSLVSKSNGVGAAVQGLGKSFGDVGQAANTGARSLAFWGDAQGRIKGGADQAAGAAQGLTREFTKTGKELLTASNGFKYWVDEQGRARTESGRFVSALEKAQAGIAGVAPPAQRTARSFSDLAESSGLVQGAIGGLAFAMTNALGNAVGAAYQGIQQLLNGYVELQAELKLAAAAAGEQGGYEKLARTVDQVAIEAAGTSLEVAKLTTELIRGGMTVDQANASLSAIVRGAEATGTGFADMGSVVSASLKGFGLEAQDASRVVDTLVQGANASATSVGGMGNAFKYAAPVARILGVSVEDLGATVGLFANAGISAEEAGVALRNGLSKLAGAAPQTGGQMKKLTGQAAQAAESMKALGVNIYNADGTLKPMRETLITLKGAFDKLGPASKIQLASNLFGGEDDGAKWLSLLNQSNEDIIKMVNTMANSKGATDKARDAMQSFSLSMKQLGGTIDSIGLGFGKVLATAIYPFIQAANAILGPIAALPGPVKDLTAALILLTAAYVGAKVARAAFGAAMKQEAVAAAITEIRQLTGVIKAELVTDIGRARDAFGSFAAAVRNGNMGPAITGLQQLASGLRNLKAKEVTAGATQALSTLFGTIRGGSAQGVTSLNALSGSIQQSLGAALLNSGKSIDKWGRDLFMTASRSKEAEKGLTGLTLVLQRGMTSGAADASAALRGTGSALAALGVGSTAAVVAAAGLAAALAVVVGAAVAYNKATQQSREVTAALAPSIEKLREEWKKLGVQMKDTTALGTDLDRFSQDVAGNLGEMVQNLIPIPNIGGLVAQSFKNMGEQLKLVPFVAVGIGINEMKNKVIGLYKEFEKSQKINTATANFNVMSNALKQAQGEAGSLTVKLNSLPDGQKLDKGQSAAVNKIGAQLSIASTQAAAFKSQLLRLAEAERASGNKAYADQLVARANSIQVNIDRTEKLKAELFKEAAARGANVQVIAKEVVSLEAVAEALKKREASNQVQVLNAEAAALQQVIAGNLTSAQAVVQKEAATRSALTNEIALIDQQLAQASAVDRVSEQYANLKKQRSEKALQLAQLEVQAIERRRAAEQELNQVIANAPVRRFEDDIQGITAVRNLQQAINDLQASQFGLVKVRLDAELEGAQARGASEKEINNIKLRQARLDAEAARQREIGLNLAQRLERQIFEITQQKAQLEAQLAVNTARVELRRKELDLTNAQKTGVQSLIDAARAEYDLANENYNVKRQGLSLVQQLQPLERQIADLGREKARNEASAATYAANFKAAMAESLATGRPLQEILNRGTVSLSQWANSAGAFQGNLQSTQGALSQVRNQISGIGGGFNSAATGAKAIGLYGRASIGSYTGIGNSLSSAASSADDFAGTGIDSVTGAAADEASGLRSNMAGAKNEAVGFYNALAAAAGLPDARWAGGPVQAGQSYRINDGPGGRSLGQEAFLNSSGNVSLIQRAANSLWTAPSKGVVLPAGVTARLQEQGILPGGATSKSGSGRIRAMGIRPQAGTGTARLERAIATLAVEVAELRRKDWDVHVHERGHGRHQRLIGMLGQLT